MHRSRDSLHSEVVLKTLFEQFLSFCLFIMTQRIAAMCIPQLNRLITYLISFYQVKNQVIYGLLIVGGLLVYD